MASMTTQRDPDIQQRTLQQARRIVVKIGSALLVDGPSGTIRGKWMASVAQDIRALRANGTEVIVVSSGAIAVGRHHLGLTGTRLRLAEKQAAAATGQIRLAHAWQEAMAEHGITVAQILLTLGDSEDRRRYLNARNTLDTLIRLGALPVVNENDTVATQEIRFGDNDRLAARVAEMVAADTLVLLSDIDGLYTADPSTNPSASLIPEVRELTPDIMAAAGGSRPGVGTGGMVTKLMAARIAMNAGCAMVIASGHTLHPLATINQPGQRTWFLPSGTVPPARKKWISGSIAPMGCLVVDAGAAQALQDGGSLLPAGVTRVDGEFSRGDTVRIMGPDGSVLGHGLSNYTTTEARQIMGRHSTDIANILGCQGRNELIHRDDMVIDPIRGAQGERDKQSFLG
ncbi:glutamate 5-kinase [Haematospirillum jordaniae]|uniref:Glutamate 5-kinase n=1 Tax=Haematospirillum jordaniae TaxID=1549855 RepID=A0A143DDE9_9PROT|nr:glutamate 5-kinase [Haematospirillum jordaniae]AMW34148.1 glutamate 5-kinase [Haematospirillum jordaniae]NKD45883.1 glutamate 5-kinase [Haematospirillum jordaniae]NKD57200.1 glutamate 5-kinase [Haematospirillum jordaniae]NKD59433.1 glutamate 5-kinase [Haematospirillum jordaniae]NKD67126.1 glutamate 5-kinase [Haematospirillum jordaniae]